VVFVIGILVIMLWLFGVYGDGGLVGDQRGVILAGDEGQEEDV